MTEESLNKALDLTHRITKGEILVAALESVINPNEKINPSTLTIELFHKQMIPVTEKFIPDFDKNFKGTLIATSDFDYSSFQEIPKAKVYLRWCYINLARLRREFSEL